MEQLPARAVALIRESIRKMVEEDREPDPANVAEIEVLARLAGAPASETLNAWLRAARVRGLARRTRAESVTRLDEARRVRVRGRLRVIHGREAIAAR